MTFNGTKNGKPITGDEVLELLRAEGVFADVRKPDALRITPAALYNSFEDVFHFVTILISVLRG
jgi:kynureninase